MTNHNGVCEKCNGTGSFVCPFDNVSVVTCDCIPAPIDAMNLVLARVKASAIAWEKSMVVGGENYARGRADAMRYVERLIEHGGVAY